MKNTGLLLLMITLSLNGFSQVCTPLVATGMPGLSPFTENLACVQRGVFYDEVIYLENFTGVNTPNGLVTINYLRIDSLTNVPCGLLWIPDDADTTYLSGQTGCIKVSGTSFENEGQYKLGIYVTVEGNIPGLGIQTFSGEASDLVTTLQALTGSSFGINFNYWIRVTEPGITCAVLDTTSSGNNLLSTCNQVCVSNPPTGIPGLTPSTETLSCIERGVFYDQVISLENFDSINIPTPPISAIIVFLRIDSITNIPCGIGWETNKPNNTLGKGETGCIRVTGTTNDILGQYKLRMYFTIGGVVPALGPDTLELSGEATEILDSIQNLFGVSIPINLNYWVRVTNQGVACVALDTSSSATNLLACGSSPLSVSVSGTNTICSGQSTQLTVVTTGGNPPYNYIWSPGGGTTSVVSVSPANSTTYSVTVTDATPSSHVTSYTVNVFNKPTANFSVTTNGRLASVNNGSSSNTLDASWDFGDGSSSTAIAPPAHTYAKDTVYIITLIASNDCGADTFSRTINLSNPMNGITPVNEGTVLFSVYPNPSSGIVAIQSDNAEPDLYKIRLFDVRGKEVYSSEIWSTAATFSHSVNLEDLPKGIYTLHIGSKKGAFTGKVALY